MNQINTTTFNLYLYVKKRAFIFTKMPYFDCISVSYEKYLQIFIKKCFFYW